MLGSGDTTLQNAAKLASAGRIAEAQAAAHAAMKNNRKNPLLYAVLGQIAETRGDLDEAAEQYRKSLRLDPKQVMTHIALGQIRTNQGRYKEAIAGLERALKLQPDLPHAVAALADAYDKQGRGEQAVGIIRPFIERDEETPRMAVVYCTVMSNRGEHEAAIEIGRKHLAREDADANARQLIGYAVGRSLEKLGRHDEAFEAYETANAADAAAYDHDAFVRHIDGLIEVFSAENLARLPRSPRGGEQMVFIVGMPRSGTTLVERIIDAHPRARGVGETIALQRLVADMGLTIMSNEPYPRCVLDLEPPDVDQLARSYLEEVSRTVPRDTRRIVDKNLLNWQNLGLIALLFPKARIVHCRRHPLDTCFSCFTSALYKISNPWAGDLRGLGLAYRQYRRLMAHWADALDMPMLEVRYESVVDDSEAESRRLIDFVGLEWHDNCLRFHESSKREQRAGIAPTLSYDQVRRPVYRSSCGRWEPFRDHLGPLIDALGLDPDSATADVDAG